MKRPLGLVALFYVVGILIAGYIPLPPALLLGFGLVLTVISLAASAHFRKFPLIILIFFTGWTNSTLRTVIISPHDLRTVHGAQPQLAVIRGTLRETPNFRVFVQDETESWRTLAQMDVSSISLSRQPWQPASGRLAVSTPGTLTNIFGKQVVEITGVVHRPKIAAANGTFDYRAYLKHLGIYYQLDASSEQDWQIISGPAKPPLGFWERPPWRDCRRLARVWSTWSCRTVRSRKTRSG